ncbi:MAG: glycosyltransferase family 4 protein [Verrucomicrobiota bacterium]
MKIAILHYTSWPEIGGVENVAHDQAALLTRMGHEVLLISGKGKDPDDGYAFVTPEQLDPEYPLHLAVRKVLDNGQADQNFNKYRAELTDLLRPMFAEADVTIVHNIFTMHFNLPLTLALHDLSKEFRLIAWTHDIVKGEGSDYSLPNPDKPPWNLMSMAAANVPYVTASDQRRNELEATLKPVPEVTVVPNVIDLGRLFDLSLEMRESLDALALGEREFVFLLPAKLLVRKNVEFAIEAIERLKDQGRMPLLLITAPDDSHTPSVQYAQFLRESLSPKLKRYVVFVNEFFPVKQKMLVDLYQLADCLFFPSKQEGFGLPLLEAALFRLPIICRPVPAFWSTQGEGCFTLESMDQLDDAINWLESQPTFRLQRLVRRQFDGRYLYRKFYEPLLESVAAAPGVPK